MKVSNLLNEYFRSSHSFSSHRIIESLPKSVPIEVKKSLWKRDLNNHLTRTFLFEQDQELIDFIHSLMKIISQFSLKQMIEFSVYENSVTIIIKSQKEIEVSDFLNQVLHGEDY